MPHKILRLDEIMKLRNNIEMRDALIDALKEAEKRILELEKKNKELMNGSELKEN